MNRRCAFKAGFRGILGNSVPKAVRLSRGRIPACRAVARVKFLGYVWISKRFLQHTFNSFMDYVDMRLKRQKAFIFFSKVKSIISRNLKWRLELEFYIPIR